MTTTINLAVEASCTIEQMRADIARMIDRERRAAIIHTNSPDSDDIKAGDLGESAWRVLNPGLAAFYDLTNPAKSSAKSVKS